MGLVQKHQTAFASDLSIWMQKQCANEELKRSVQFGTVSEYRNWQAVLAPKTLAEFLAQPEKGFPLARGFANGNGSRPM